MYRNLGMKSLGVFSLQSETIESALSYGFRSIDLNYDDFRDSVHTYGLAHARRMIDSAKIRLGSFRLPFVLGGNSEKFEKSLAKLSEDASWLAEINCTRCIAAVRPNDKELPYHENFELHKNRLQKLGEVLEEHGIRVGVGFDAARPHKEEDGYEFIRSLDALIALLGMIPKNNVGANVDLWQLYKSGGDVEQIRQLAPERIINVVVSDAIASLERDQPPEHSRVLPGETGVIDSVAAIRLLEELGYDGPVTPAADKSNFPEMARDNIAKKAGDAMRRLWESSGLSAPATVLVGASADENENDGQDVETLPE